MTIRRGMTIFGVCVLLLLAQVLLFWARTKTAVPPTAAQKVMMLIGGGTALVGVFAVLGAFVERLTKKAGIGQYTLLAALGLYVVFALLL